MVTSNLATPPILSGWEILWTTAMEYNQYNPTFQKDEQQSLLDL